MKGSFFEYSKLEYNGARQHWLYSKISKVFLFCVFCSLFATSCGATVPSTKDDVVQEATIKTENQKQEFTKVAFYQDLDRVLETGDMQKITNLFESVPQEYAGDVGINCVHASLLLSAGDTQQAKTIASGLLTKNPNDKDVLALNMQLAKATNDKTAKQKIIKQLIALNPNDPCANTELADEQSLKRNYKVANTYYKKALLGDKEYIEALVGVGKTSYFLRQNSQGKIALQQALKIDPQNATAYSYLAKIAADESNYSVAIDNIKKAIQIDDTVVDFHLDYGSYLRSQGDFSGAQAQWTRAIDLEPQYFLGYAYRGGLYDEQDKYDLALKDYLKLVQTNPKYYFAYESIGILLWHEGNYSKAKEAFAKAKTYNEDNISYPLMIAACLYKEGKSLEAKKSLEPELKYLKNNQSLAKNVADKDRYAIEYDVARLFYDFAGEAQVTQKVRKVSNSTRRGKLLYYIGLFYELNNGKTGAKDFYQDVASMEAPMFFEYRLALWSIEK